MEIPLKYFFQKQIGIYLTFFSIIIYYDHSYLYSSDGHSKDVSLFSSASQAMPLRAVEEHNSTSPRTNLTSDYVEDSFFDPISPDPSCNTTPLMDCSSPPNSTIEEVDVTTLIDVTALYGGEDPSTFRTDEAESNLQERATKSVPVDKHWGRDEAIIKMRDKLRYGHLPTRSTHRAKNEKTQNTRDDHTDENADDNHSDILEPHSNKRPPVFLLPGLASTRLVSWKNKGCSNPLLSPIKALEYVWMNINLLIQARIDSSCFAECMTLGKDQADMDDENVGCKLRADEGLDAISSLAPGSIGSSLFVGGTNTVYAWLINWLADNLGYDSSSIVGLPYDWRLSPDVMEKRDGFLTLMRKRIEAAVESNGYPGIMVAHSMGNNIFRYFLEWLRHEMHIEAYRRHVKRREQNLGRTIDILSLRNHRMRPIGRGRMGIRRTKTISVYNVDLLGSVDLHTTKYNRIVYGRESGAASNRGVEATKSEDQLREIAIVEGDQLWLDWVHTHIWTYVGLAAPLLGATNPLRAVFSGENMGLPMSDEVIRNMEISFGSTHTLNPISTKNGFCDKEGKSQAERFHLACLDELLDGIERAQDRNEDNPWRSYPTLKRILQDRIDWESDRPPVVIRRDVCSNKDKACNTTMLDFSAQSVENGDIFLEFSNMWKERDDPLGDKRKQLMQSWWNNPFPNPLNTTWDRPHIKHIIMAYGVNVPTEFAYVYKKIDFVDDDNQDRNNDIDGLPTLSTVYWEEPNGLISEQSILVESKSLADSVINLALQKKRKLIGQGSQHLSGDGSVPYLSLSWAHSWLLHATRAMKHSAFGLVNGERISDENALHSIVVSHRERGGSEWIMGAKEIHGDGSDGESHRVEDPDTGTSHPHGTKYKPEMFRYQSKGKSRSSGMEYTTAVIEAVGVEHKESTRNYDILAAVFTDVLRHMHDDGLL